MSKIIKNWLKDCLAEKLPRERVHAVVVRVKVEKTRNKNGISAALHPPSTHIALISSQSKL